MNKKRLKEWLKILDEGILNETIDIPDNAIIALPESISIFTTKRLELLETIKDKHPRSVQELAAMTRRAKQAVTRDLKILERFDLVRLERKGRIAVPIVEREVVVFTVPRHAASLMDRRMAAEDAV